MADTDVETVTFTISADGEEETLTVPRGVIDLVSEEEDTPTRAVGDVAMLSLANRVHHLLHHQEGEPDEELVAIEDATMELFEDRFGVSFAEATGHSH